MCNRLQEIYGKEAVGLAHGRAGYVIRRTFDEENDLDPRDHRLFSSVFAKPVVVATLDQYLIGHLQGRHWEERVTLSQRATVILDEVHTYEPFTLGLLKAALDTAPPEHLAVASATLPSYLLHLLEFDGDLLRAEAQLWQRKRHHIELREGPILHGLSEIAEQARSGKRVLVVVNTVPKAQEVFRTLQKMQVPSEYLELLHSRFTYRDRIRKEQNLQHPPPGMVLVSTQVVEVSLDISFDVLYTEIAPIDALVQRMGRVNRKGDRPPAPVKIYTEWDKGSVMIYGEDILVQSLEALKQIPTIPTDQDLINATEAVYQCITAQESYQREIEEGVQNLREIQKVLGCYTIDLSDERLRSYFMTRRRGMVSIEVLPESLREEAEDLLEKGEKWRLVELLVPIPVYWLVRGWGSLFWKEDNLGILTSLQYTSTLGIEHSQDTHTTKSFHIIDL